MVDLPPLCQDCHGACCRVFLVLDKKKLREEEYIQWLLLHPNTGTLRGVAYLLGKCSQLSPAGRCRIYKDRPRICKALAVGGDICRACRAIMDHEKHRRRREHPRASSERPGPMRPLPGVLKDPVPRQSGLSNRH